MILKTTIAAAALLVCSIAHADWTYTDDIDVMTGKSTHLAMIDSVNSMNLERPYSGKNHASLAIRRAPKTGVNVIFRVDKGQIICNAYSGCSVSVRFDDSPPVRWSASGSADHSSTMLFLRNESKFIAASTKAKRILIQVLMYQAGQQVLEFTSATPLKWEPQKGRK